MPIIALQVGNGNGGGGGGGGIDSVAVDETMSGDGTSSNVLTSLPRFHEFTDDGSLVLPRKYGQQIVYSVEPSSDLKRGDTVSDGNGTLAYIKSSRYNASTLKDELTLETYITTTPYFRVIGGVHPKQNDAYVSQIGDLSLQPWPELAGKSASEIIASRLNLHRDINEQLGNI